ncbi:MULTISPECIES: DinB family protein [unclassified Arthrobacter]|uniref:DinB family protein n=1 Tax=unclassified Arthrobacter TaxID=235627 RepID=UPI001C85ADFD|nr:DinB family protein [Arthrobacter sp. MAHUQ-56]MBX7444882.1 DinB family protein [Arthrobacter sp. MAHUQ-56]
MDASGKDSVREDLLWIADDFRKIILAVPHDELDRPSTGTRWTNRQLLFHMALGQNIALAGIPLLGLFSHLPPSASRNWSRLLDACAGPYNWVNWAGSAAGGKVLTPRAMLGMMDRTTRTIVAWYDRADSRALGRGMAMPTRWDPYFAPWMNRRDIMEWAPKHYRHHRAQLSLTALPS